MKPSVTPHEMHAQKIRIPLTSWRSKYILFLPNVQDEPRPCLARLVLLGARGVTDRVVGSSAWLGSVVKKISCGTVFRIQ